MELAIGRAGRLSYGRQLFNASWSPETPAAQPTTGAHPVGRSRRCCIYGDRPRNRRDQAVKRIARAGLDWMYLGADSFLRQLSSALFPLEIIPRQTRSPTADVSAPIMVSLRFCLHREPREGRRSDAGFLSARTWGAVFRHNRHSIR